MNNKKLTINNKQLTVKYLLGPIIFNKKNIH